MNAIFAEEIAEGWLIVYMDNLLIATKDDLQFHKKCIHRILEKLKKHDLYLKPEKCAFEQCKIKVLGVILKNGMVQMDPAKVKGVADWLPPQNVRHVLLPRIYRLLLLLHTKLLPHHPTSDPTHMKEHPIQMGPILHTCFQTPQVLDVC